MHFSFIIRQNVDIRNVRKKHFRVIRISSGEKRNLMNEILQGIKNEQIQPSPVKKVTWKDVTDEKLNSAKHSII